MAKGQQEETQQAGLAKFSPVYYINLMLSNLLYASTTVCSSST